MSKHEKVELSSDLLASLGNAGSSGELVLTSSPRKKIGKKKKKKKSAFDETNVAVERPERAVPSRKRGQRGAEEFLQRQKDAKRSRKAREKAEDANRRKERRKELLKSLEDNQLTSEEQNLLRGTTTLGTDQSVRQQLRMSLLRERAGLTETMTTANETEQEKPTETQEPVVTVSSKKPKNAKRENKVQLVTTTTVSSSSDEDDEEDEMELDETPRTVPSSSSPPPAQPKKEAKKPTKPVLKPQDEDDEAFTMIPQLKVRQSTRTVEDETSRFVVRVERSEEVEKSRHELPVCLMEEEIMETVEKHDVTVICGETGSGKTTQTPQFLFEAGFGCKESPNPFHHGLVAVTQPRRVATVSMAQRVAAELGEAHGKYVGYQIRYDSRTDSNTRLKFMTDGVLLREAREDLLLRKYSVIILDEAHERNLNTDIILGLLSRVVPLRQQLYNEKKPGVFPLRVLIMSATLRVEDFAKNPRIFTESPPPVVNVESRQFPVSVHFSRRTELQNYLQTAFRKVCAIHRRLPPGGILVFLTGQREIEWMVRSLKKKFGNNKVIAVAQTTPKDDGQKEDEEVDYSDIESDDGEDDDRDAAGDGKEVDEKKKVKEEAEKEVPVSSGGRIKEAEQNVDISEEPAYGPLHVLPLFSRLPTKQQLEVFKDVPAGHRLVVVATNVAETSVTIPGIRYVVDSGREKRKTYDQISGTSAFEIGWVSQASANQRMGRAGRTGPGHCYRLYSSAVFNDHFEMFSKPEICRLPIEDIVLYMKTMGIEKIQNFPFPTVPDLQAVDAAEARLLQLGALGRQKKDPENLMITILGRRMTHFPVCARLAKMLSIAACDAQCTDERLAYVIAVVAALSLQAPFLHTKILNEGVQASDSEAEDSEDEADVDKKKSKENAQDLEKQRQRESVKHKLFEQAKNAAANWFAPTSDAISLLIASGAFHHVVSTQSNRKVQQFCRDQFLHFKTMREQMQLRQQLARLVAKTRLEASRQLAAEYDPDSDDEDEEGALELTDDEANDEPLNSVHLLSKKLCGSLKPLKKKEDEVYLRQVIISGYLDQIARKMTRDEARALSDEHDYINLNKRWPYVSCNPTVDTPLFIHAHSNLHSTNSNELPEYVAYSHIEASMDVICYMRQVTRINPSWLFDLSKGTIQCTLGPILETPPPSYDPQKDTMVACVYPMYGPRRWRLPSQWVPFPADTEEQMRARARWFGRALLEGKVLTEFMELKDWLTVPAAYMTRKFHEPRVQALTNLLLRGSEKLLRKKKRKKLTPVYSRSTLISIACKDPTFLYEDLLKDWIKKEYVAEFKNLWLKIISTNKKK